MTAATEATTVVEHGIRFNWPGNPIAQIVPCGDLDSVHALMDSLAGRGVTLMEPVTRPGWVLNREGLPAAVRHLAEARLDDQLDDRDVRARLALWLADGAHSGVEATRAWRDLLTAIVAHHKALAGDVDRLMVEPEMRDAETLIRHLDGLVDDAARKVAGDNPEDSAASGRPGPKAANTRE